MAILARDEVTLVAIIDIASTARYYLLQASNLAAPGAPTANPPGGSWSLTEPTYTEGSTNTLYTVDLTVYGNGTFAYSPVSLSTSYEAAKAAYNKAMAAQNTATTADGRITIATANPTTTDAAGKPLNAVWEVRSGTEAVRRFVLTSLSPVTWTQVRIGQDFVGDDAIGTAQIADAAITNAKINDLNASKITAGLISADRIGANTITSDKLLIGDMTNMSISLQSTGERAAYPAGDQFVYESNSTLSPGGANAPWIAKLGPGTGYATSKLGKPFAVTPGEEIYISCKIRRAAANVSVSLNLWAKSASGSTVLFDNRAFTARSTATDNTWVTYEGRVTMPAGAAFAEPQFKRLTSGTQTGNWYFADPIIRRVATGELIVDGAIDGKTISGGTFHSPSATALPRLTIGGSKIEVLRDDGEGNASPTIILGGAASDELILDTAGGKSGFDADGNGLVSGSFSVGGDVLLGGESLSEAIDRLPKGILADWRRTLNGAKAGTDYGLFRLNVDTVAGRRYRFVFDGYFAPQQSNDGMGLTLRRASGVNTATVTSGQVNSWIKSLGTANILERVHVEHEWVESASGPWCFGLCYSNRYSTARWIEHRASSNYPAFGYIEDLGADNGRRGVDHAMGGTAWSTPPADPAPALTTTTTTLTATTLTSWRGTSTVTDFLHHGTYDGVTRASFAGFSGLSVLSGSTVKKVEIYLDNEHWWGSSGTVRFGTSTSSSAPGSRPTSSANQFDSTGWTKGAAKWVTMPSSWNINTLRGFTLGAGAPTTTTYYGKFVNARSAVKIRVTYEK